MDLKMVTLAELQNLEMTDSFGTWRKKINENNNNIKTFSESVNQEITNTNENINNVEENLTNNIESVERELNNKIDNVKTELDSDIIAMVITLS